MAIPVTFAVRPAESGGVQVTVQLGIETELGQRLDKSGKPVKPHFVEEVSVFHEGRNILVAYLGPAVARTPEISFRVEGARPGDVVTIKGRDNRGDEFEATHRLA